MMANEGYNEKYGWAPTPILKKGSKPYTNTLGATGTAIYAKTRYPEAAFRVFEWYNAGEYGLHRAKTGWGIPPLYSLHQYLPKDNKFNRDRLNIALEDAKHFVPYMGGMTPFADPGPLFGNAWNAYIDGLVEGDISYDTFVDRFYADINETLAAGKEELGM
jgi:ABC-type glycerol-3-phosphate transport system substrate-binding protein